MTDKTITTISPEEKLARVQVLREAQKTPDEVQCPACQGQGVVKKWHGDRSPDRDCKTCLGTCVVTQQGFEAYYERM